MRKQCNLRHYCYDLRNSEELQPKAWQLLPLTSGCDEANDQPTPSPATFEYKQPDGKEFSSTTTSDETSSSKPPVAKAEAKKPSAPKVKAKAKSQKTAKAKAAAKEAGHAPESEQIVAEGDGSTEPMMVVDPAESLLEEDQDGNVYDCEPDMGDDLEEGIDEGKPKVEKPKPKAAPKAAKAKAKAKSKAKAKANPKAKGKGKAKPKGGAKAEAKSRQWFGETGEAVDDTETAPDTDPNAASSDAAPGAINVKRRPAAQPKKAGFMQCAAVTVSHVLSS